MEAGGPTTSVSSAGVPLGGRNYATIETLLRDLGLEVYIEIFAKEHVDIDTVRSLPRLEVENIFKELGVSVGHRIKIFQALGSIPSTRGVPVSQPGIVAPPATAALPSVGGGSATFAAPSSSAPSAGASPIFDYSSAYKPAAALPGAPFLFSAPSPVAAFAAPPASNTGTATKSVDVCFLMDCTGSMEFWINGTRSKIFDIVQEVLRAYPSLTIKLAFIGYRDRKDAIPLQTLPFTPDVGVLRSFVTNVAASGGGDVPEDVHAGLREVLKLSWSADVRLLIHFADAPAHGRMFTEANMADDYPANDLNGEEAREMIFRLAAAHIDYYFVEISKQNTTKMVATFGNWYNSAPGRKNFMQVLPMAANANQFVRGVVGAILTSVRTSEIKR